METDFEKDAYEITKEKGVFLEIVMEPSCFRELNRIAKTHNGK
jgi:hypothetical protein